MESNIINDRNKIRIKASVLLNKFKHKDDRINFCRERSKILYITHRLLFPQRNLLRQHIFPSMAHRRQKSK